MFKKLCIFMLLVWPVVAFGATNYQPEEDKNMQGQYFTQSQSITDLSSAGPSFFFDGVDDYVDTGETFQAIFRNSFSVVSLIKPTDGHAAQRFFGSKNASVEDWQYFGLDASGQVIFAFESNNTSVYATTGVIFEDGQGPQTYLAAVADSTIVGANGIKVYVNGDIAASGDTSSIVFTDYTSDVDVFLGMQNGSSSPFNGQISRTLLFNLALSADEVKALSSGGEVPYKYVGASQTEMITDSDDTDFAGGDIGNWVVNLGGGGNGTCVYDAGPGAVGTGKVTVGGTPGIRTNAKLDQSDFTSWIGGKIYKVTADVYIPSANNNWTELDFYFDLGGKTVISETKATLTTEDAWQEISIVFQVAPSDISSGLFIFGDSTTTGDIFYFDNISVTQIGCVLDLNPSGITPSQWVDSSPNHLNGTVNGAKVVNEPAPVIRGSQVNLLTNSGFGVWSQSDGLYTTAGTVPVTANVAVGRGLAPNNSCTTPSADTEADATTGWDAGTFNVFASDTEGTEPDGSYSLHLTANVNGQYAKLASAITTEVGKLYELNIVYKNADGVAGSEIAIRASGTSTTGSEYGSIETISATWTTWTLVFEATTTSFYMWFQEAGVHNDCDVYIDSISLHEVTPGITSGTSAGPDGWRKTNTLDIYRQHYDATYTKPGSFYSLKMVKGSDTAEYAIWPIGGIDNSPAHLQRFAGRTVTFGCWVYSITKTDSFKLALWDGDTFVSSDVVSTADSWQWVEVTSRVRDAPSYFRAYLATNAIAGNTGAIAYISQPMLVFGDSIGTGNAVQPPREVIWFEDAVTLTDYNNDAISDAAINLLSQSSGKIPQGAKAVYVNATGTGAGITDKIELYESSSKVINGVKVNLPVAANPGSATGWQPCDSDGNIHIDEVGTVTATTLKIIGVEVN